MSRGFPIVAICISILSAGCVNPINAKTSTNYAHAANTASNSGDWATARKYLSRAIVNAQLGGASPAQLAVLNYEYGRASGVVCEFTDAEKALMLAYDLDKQAGGPSYLSLVELSRLNLDQKKFPEAVSYFERALPELEAKGASSLAPIAFADILDEYSTSLDFSGRTALAQEVAARAIKIRNENPGKSSKTDRTPYGTKCQTS